LVGGSLYHNIEGNLDGCAANSLLGAAIKSPDTLPCGLPWVTKYDRRADHDVQRARFPERCPTLARRRKIIATAYENGHPTALPVALLRALEENLRSNDKYRLL